MAHTEGTARINPTLAQIWRTWHTGKRDQIKSALAKTVDEATRAKLLYELRGHESAINSLSR